MFFLTFIVPVILAGVIRCNTCSRPFSHSTAFKAHTKPGTRCEHAEPSRDDDQLRSPDATPAKAPSDDIDPADRERANTPFSEGLRPDARTDERVTQETVESLATAFDSRRELYRFVKSCRNGAGLTEEVKSLLRVLNHPQFNRAEISGWKGARDLDKYAEEVIGKHHGTWRKRMVQVEGMDEPVELEYCDTLQALKSIFGNASNSAGFQLRLRVEFDKDKKRVYSTPETALWWSRAQRALPNKEGVVAALIASSDVTHLSHNGRQKVWPLQLTVANIPRDARWKDTSRSLVALLPMPDGDLPASVKTALFNKCLDIVFEPLISASYSGAAMNDPNGVERIVYPLMYAYVCDYPEGCKVTGTMQQRADKPCSMCEVPREFLDCMDRLFKVRDIKGQREAMQDPKKAQDLGTHPIECFLWKWNFAWTPWGNPCGKQTHPGCLPSWMELAVIKTFLEWYAAAFRVESHTEDSIDALTKKQQNLLAILKRQFPKQTSKWQLIKVHALTHLPYALETRAVPEEYSTNLFEHSHVRLVKRPYRSSNRRQINKAIISADEIRRAMGVLPTAIQGDKKYMTAMAEVMLTGKPAMTKTSDTMVLVNGQGGKRKAVDIWEAYCKSLPEDMPHLSSAMARYGLECTTIQRHLTDIPTLPSPLVHIHRPPPPPPDLYIHFNGINCWDVWSPIAEAPSGIGSAFSPLPPYMDTQHTLAPHHKPHFTSRRPPSPFSVPSPPT
ncbi:unnamed protein product [Closterium sp. Yama58-4]|nr:unnamed protein product [Closterium sp. Yama58-4]